MQHRHSLFNKLSQRYNHNVAGLTEESPVPKIIIRGDSDDNGRNSRMKPSRYELPSNSDRLCYRDTKFLVLPPHGHASGCPDRN